MMKYLIAIIVLLVGCTPPPLAAAPATAAPTVTHTITATMQPAPHPTTSATVTRSTEFCTVTTGGDILNLRKAPGMDAEIIGGLMDGAEVQVLAIGGEWLYVKTGNTTGYIYSEYCEAGK